jgi:large subunit ribosomal protein L25
MSQKTNLKAAIRNRTGSGRLNQMRKEGWLPSVMYGLGKENKNLKVDLRTFVDVLAHSTSENILVNLDIEGVGQSLAFLQAVQHHNITGAPIHADFRAIDENTEIVAHVPLDVTSLEIGDSLHIGDLKLPTGVVATHAASVVVAHLGKPRVVEIVAVVEKAAPAKGKKK